MRILAWIQTASVNRLQHADVGALAPDYALLWRIAPPRIGTVSPPHRGDAAERRLGADANESGEAQLETSLPSAAAIPENVVGTPDQRSEVGVARPATEVRRVVRFLSDSRAPRRGRRPAAQRRGPGVGQGPRHRGQRTRADPRQRDRAVPGRQRTVNQAEAADCPAPALGYLITEREPTR